MTWKLTPELEDEIIEALTNGEGLRSWCSKEGRPSRTTVLKWQRENNEFSSKCAHAREAAGELAAERHNEVIEGCLNGSVAPDVAGRVLSGLQWRAAKLASKKYGDKVDVNHGGQPQNPVVVTNETDEQILKRFFDSNKYNKNEESNAKHVDIIA